MNKLLLAAALAALCACSPQAPAPAETPAAEELPPGVASFETVAWTCDNGATFSSRLKEDGNAEVIAGGQTYQLPATIVASGNRYFDGTVEFWEKGGEAMLNGAAGGPYENCKS
jgi:membrane-bound inhibitor of C-type lysozyme